ncbi:MAG: helix-turn-helix transcriptional regulator [Verrucomicrobiota bacterium]
MRVSPLLHPLAVLRTTIGLTQKQMGDFVNRAARTIQSIELGKMPLTDELALRIAEVTGVDEAWLFAGDPSVPPPKGVTLVNAGRGEGEYTKADYEFYRAFMDVEAKLRDDKEWEAAVKNAEANGNQVALAELVATKLDVMARQKGIIDIMDQGLVAELQLILAETKLTENMRLTRWKIRRFLDDLAKEFSIKIPKLKTSVGVNEFANFPPAPEEQVAAPAEVRRRPAQT